jgi:hypothetical protein
VSNNPSMQAAFPLVLFGSIVLFIVMGLLSMLTRNNLYDQIGQGGLTMGEDQLGGGVASEPSGMRPAIDGVGPGGAGGTGSVGDPAERDQEIRQMLQARSDRLVRQGHAPLDIDAELARLQPPDHPRADGSGSHDAALAAEVRQLVVARNERRGRRGLEPVDVEAEVQRTLAELDP